MDFLLGAVVLPASDGRLAELGYDVVALGPLALGVIIEEGSRRSHVHFPELKLSLWLDESEIKDVAVEMKRDPSFAVVQKYFDQSYAEMLMPLLAQSLIHRLQATHVLGVDHGTFEDVWEEAASKLKDYYQGEPSLPVFRLSLGLEELRTKEWEELQRQLGERLVLTRLLPSGMHKFEISLYLKRDSLT